VAALAVLLLTFVLARSSWANYRARRETERAYQAYRDQVSASVPAFVRAARLFVAERNFDDALAQVSTAVDSAQDNAEARLLKAQLLIGRKEFAQAREELEAYLQMEPGDQDAARLAELCKEGHPDDALRVEALVEVLARQRMSPIAFSLEGSSDRRIALLQKRLQETWPGCLLVKDADGGIGLDLSNRKDVNDLSPLKGLPINRLDLSGCVQVRDLTPLQGMPLRSLRMLNLAGLRDLTPLQGLPLTNLSAAYCGVRDLAPLRGMKLRDLALHGSPVEDLSPLEGMPLTTLNVAHTQVRDLGPLKQMPLTYLELTGCNPVQDYTPLKNLKLTMLAFGGDQVRDLTLLRGMPLASLHLRGCSQLKDLSPLEGMRLSLLELSNCSEVEDLAPLKGMPLTSLSLIQCVKVRNLDALEGMKLKDLDLRFCNGVKDLKPLRGMPLTSLLITYCEQITDLTPLEGVNLEALSLTPKRITGGLDVLRKMKSLKRISTSEDGGYPVEEFWKKYDAGEFDK
jgi:Leucine-rich repeat (LRR) protein